MAAMLSFTREAAWLASWEQHPGLGTRERRSRALRRTGRRHGMEFRSPSEAGAFHDGSLGGRVSRNRVYSMAIRFRTLVILFAVALPGAEAGAHTAPHARVDALTLDLARRPDDWRVWIERAQAYLEDGHPTAALSDLDRAEALAPRRPEVPLERGAALLALGLATPADDELTTAIERAPSDAEAHGLRARARIALGRPREAAADFQRAVELSERPSPDQFLEWSRALAAAGAGRIDEALRVLDRGLATLGESFALVEEGVRLECAHGAYQAALERIERHPTAWGSSAARRARSGDVLRAAGREIEAQAEYSAALAELEAAPHRYAARASSLENRIHFALRQGPPVAAGP